MHGNKQLLQSFTEMHICIKLYSGLSSTWLHASIRLYMYMYITLRIIMAFYMSCTVHVSPCPGVVFSSSDGDVPVWIERRRSPTMLQTGSLLLHDPCSSVGHCGNV